MFKEIIQWISSTFGKKEHVKIEEPKKKIYITWHARQRFEQRHGVVFTDEQAKDIVEDILSKKATFVSNSHRCTEEWIAEYRGKKYRVIFATDTNIIITVYSGVKDKTRKPARKGKKKKPGRKPRHFINKTKASAYRRNKKVIYDKSEYEEAV